MRENFDKPLAVVQLRYKNDYDKRVREIMVLNEYEFVFFDKPPFVANINSLETTDERT